MITFALYHWVITCSESASDRKDVLIVYICEINLGESKLIECMDEWICVCVCVRSLRLYLNVHRCRFVGVRYKRNMCHICFILMLSIALNSCEMQSLPSAGYCPTGFLYQEMIQRFTPHKS